MAHHDFEEGAAVGHNWHPEPWILGGFINDSLENSQGAFGVVHYALNSANVTIKIMPKKGRRKGCVGMTKEDFERERDLMVYIKENINLRDHAGKSEMAILEIFDAWEDANYFFFATEKLHRELLHSILSEKISFPEESIRNMFRPVFEAVKKLHDHNILHLDIRMPNLVFRGEDKKRLVLIDMGLALRLSYANRLDANVHSKCSYNTWIPDRDLLREAPEQVWRPPELETNLGELDLGVGLTGATAAIKEDYAKLNKYFSHFQQGTNLINVIDDMVRDGVMINNVVLSKANALVALKKAAGYAIGPQTDVYMLGFTLRQIVINSMGDKYSKKLHDLLDRMVHKDLADRITMRDTLDHDWFKAPPNEMMPKKKVIGNETTLLLPLTRTYSGHLKQTEFTPADRELFVETFVRPKQLKLNRVLDNISCATLEKIAADIKLVSSKKVESGELIPEMTYVVRTETATSNEYVIYNGVRYNRDIMFKCMDGITDFTTSQASTTTSSTTVSVCTTHGPFTLNNTQFKETLERAGLILLATDPVFDAVDFKSGGEGDNEIDYRELLLLLKSFSFTSDQILEHFCFRVLDSNNDGLISTNELVLALENLKLGTIATANPSPTFHLVEKSVVQKAVAEIVTAMTMPFSGLVCVSGGAIFTPSLYVLSEHVVGADSHNVVSVGCRDIRVSSGRWYYEVDLQDLWSNSVIRIGWANSSFAGSIEKGVGDCVNSWAWDGIEQLQWHNGAGQACGPAWAAEDTVGCLLDFGSNEISFFLNGVAAASVFTGINCLDMYPCVSLSSGEQVQLNFGIQRALKYPPAVDCGYGTVILRYGQQGTNLRPLDWNCLQDFVKSENLKSGLSVDALICFEHLFQV